MDLKIKDVAELLNLSETTVRRWLAEGKLPAYRLNRQYRFNRVEIEDWLLQKKLSDPLPGKSKVTIPNHLPESSSNNNRQFSLYRALYRGKLFHYEGMANKQELFSWTMGQMAEEFELDPLVMTDLFMDREMMMPTALGGGIAVPHTRDFLLNSHFDVISILFLKKPIDYGALDGKPVHTLFFLFASDDKMHLHLLAKVAHLCSNKEALSFLRTQPSRPMFLDYIKNWESTV